MVVQVFAANAGNRVVHLTPADATERMKQHFVTHFIYSEMSLLSSIICSLGDDDDDDDDNLLIYINPLGVINHIAICMFMNEFMGALIALIIQQNKKNCY